MTQVNKAHEHMYVLGTDSKRGKAWLEFARMVLEHIDTYTVPQYGDEGSDIASDYKPEDALRAMQKYIARMGRNARPAEQTRDFLKMAHYAQIAHYVWSREQDKQAGLVE